MTLGRPPVLESRSVPIGPILDLWTSRLPEHRRSDCACIGGGWCSSTESFARRVGISHTTVYRRLRRGYVDIYEADRWAAALGEHPVRVWPEWDRVAVEVESYRPSKCDDLPATLVG